MKSGMEIGHTASISFQVTEEMYAQFGGNVVHPAFSTVTMVYYMEWAARKIILPFLEDHEEGMGAAVSVKHIAPVTKGANVTVKATLTRMKGNLVFTDLEVTSDNGQIGKGEVIQAILPKTEIAQKIEASKK